MRIQRIHLAILGLIGVCWFAVGTAQAMVTAKEVDPSTLLPKSGSGVLSIAIKTQAGADVDPKDFPSPGPGLGGQSFLIVLPGATAFQLQPVSTPPSVPYSFGTGSSSLPGICTNYGTSSGPDFAVSGTQITTYDCGGTAVITTTLADGAHTFVVPQDSDLDGIPDWYEQKYCAGGDPTCLNPMDDLETPGSDPNHGDGIAVVDEARGFIIQGDLQRTEPTQKDLFVGLVNPQCSRLGNDPSLPPGGSLIANSSDPSKPPFPDDGTALFDDMKFEGITVHFVNYTQGGINPALPNGEWVDNYGGFVNGNVVYRSGTNGAASDRWIAPNAIFPLIPICGSNPCIQRGIRLIECLDDLYRTPIGYADFPTGIQVGNPDIETNSIVFTQRIYNDYANILNTASSKGGSSAYCTNASVSSTNCVFYQTYYTGLDNHGNVTTLTTTPTNRYPRSGSGATCTADSSSSDCYNINRNYIVSKYIQYVVAMELGHSVALIPELQITQYGAHYAPGTGDNLDQRVVAKDATKLPGNNGKGVLFSIPSTYGLKSNACYQLKQAGPNDPTVTACQ